MLIRVTVSTKNHCNRAPRAGGVKAYLLMKNKEWGEQFIQMREGLNYTRCVDDGWCCVSGAEKYSKSLIQILFPFSYWSLVNRRHIIFYLFYKHVLVSNLSQSGHVVVVVVLFCMWLLMIYYCNFTFDVYDNTQKSNKWVMKSKYIYIVSL